MTFFNQIAQITDHLFLSAAAAVNVSRLQRFGITHVINCTIEVPAVHSAGIDTLRISIEDAPHSRLGAYFDRCADHIKQVASGGGRTLVHCVAGVSRSASICIAYMMKYQRMTLKQAYQYIKSKRPVIRPNVGFFRQLVDYEKRIHGHNSVLMVNSPIGMVPTVYKDETKHMMW